MIPYDDLVIALQTWRARQGLPVAQLSGMLTPPPPVVAPATQPPGPPPKARPPTAPAASAVPPPLAPVDTRDEDVDEAALIDEAHYENEGDDFAMAFAPPADPEPDFESTAIGSPPPPGQQRDSFGGSTEPEPAPSKHNRNDDW